MTAYARIYGFRTYGFNEVKGREEEFTCVEGNCFLTNGDFEMLEEILKKEF